MKKVLILGAGGFIGGNLFKRLKAENCEVFGIDKIFNEYNINTVDMHKDISHEVNFKVIALEYFDEIYQLAADMGGAGYIFTGKHDAEIMSNNILINVNLLKRLVECNFKGKVFFSSSACIYPARNQQDPDNLHCDESSAYPADPDSEYGWEKLFSERLYIAYACRHGIDVRIARFHNVYGPYGTYRGGREKAPAAICRKVAEAVDGGEIEIWGTGKQTRSFIYIDDCLDGISELMESDYHLPINIGSEEMVTINDLARKVIGISEKNLTIKNVDGPVGVNGRNSDNSIARSVLGWEPKIKLDEGLRKTYAWIKEQVDGHH